MSIETAGINMSFYSIIKNICLSQKGVALITGGAGELGKATVERFVRKGAKVVLCDLPTSRGNDIARSLGDNVIFVPTDVTSEQDVATAIETTKSKFGKLNVCVNCAATACAYETYNFNKNRPHQIETFNDVMTVSSEKNNFFVFDPFKKLIAVVGERRRNIQCNTFIG